jgi:hypothetical protein
MASVIGSCGATVAAVTVRHLRGGWKSFAKESSQMQKHDSPTSTRWARRALTCGLVALGAGLLSGTAVASAEAADWGAAAPEPAAQGQFAGTAMSVPALGAAAADSTSTDSAAPAPSVAAGLVKATVIAGTGLWVHSQADVNSPHVGAALPKGTTIYVACQKAAGGINWFHIQQPRQGWVDGAPGYVSVPSGVNSIPKCVGVGEEGTESTEPTAGAGTDIVIEGPIDGPVIIGSNQVGDITTLAPASR